MSRTDDFLDEWGEEEDKQKYAHSLFRKVDELRARIAELERELQRAAERSAEETKVYIEQNARIAELEAEVDAAYMRGCAVSEKAWRREGAEAALRWADENHRAWAGPRREDFDEWFQRGLEAVCGKTNNNQGEAK